MQEFLKKQRLLTVFHLISHSIQSLLQQPFLLCSVVQTMTEPAILLAAAGWVASPLVTKLLNEGFDYLGGKGCCCLDAGIKDRLVKLETNILIQFQLVIEAAERSSEHKDRIEGWLRRLKDAFYEAEDVLDLYKYQLLKAKVSDLNSRPALKTFKKVARKVNMKLSIFSQIKLKKSLNKLEMIAAEAATFRGQLGIQIGNDGMVARQRPLTTSFPPHKVFGRQTELDKIIEYLKSASEKRYSVITIVGIGGVGKTTLAQLVCKDERVVNHFDIKIWVCVSRKLDLSRHTTQMIESSNEVCSFRESLDAMQNKLAELVKSKKVLLVLDDVWWDESTNNTETEWETFLRPLATSVESGSKVIVTTRINNLPRALGPRPEYSMALKDLEENDILSLFKLTAFDGTNLDGSQQEELMKIGNQIVQKLYRSPLAAKTVACQLNRTLNVDAWRSALTRNNLGDSQQALLWSYQRLSAWLQRCFSYFRLFPKGHKYEAERMVHLWIAEGFINSSNDSERMEEIGLKYFGELVSGSFLQNDDYNEKYYYMHDLFHDLAENVSKEDCFRIEDDDQFKDIPLTTRRLSIFCRRASEINMNFNRLENLHTLIVEDGPRSSHVIDNLFAATDKFNKKLRVLMIDDVSRGTLTNLLANLKHLRFLSFHLKEGDEFVLPATLGKLYHLQVLDTSYSSVRLPRSAKNLINLRHYVCYFMNHRIGADNKALESLPDIGRLTSLQTLPNFVVKKEKGRDIGQLKNLNEIRGRLNISNLENVEGKDKAAEANLRAKSHLEQLHLKWDKDDDVESDCRSDLDMEVLEGLQPHPNLKELTIKGCKSPRYPSWLLHLTALTHLSQSLRFLELRDCPSISSLPEHLPQSLNRLYLWDCPSISSLPEHLPRSLEHLELHNCPRISSLPEHLPQSLKWLYLRDCPSISSLPEHLLQSLNRLYLWDCPSISSLPEHLPQSLNRLLLYNCPNISSLPKHLPQSLEKLYLHNCPSISSLPEYLPQSLISITIRQCQILEKRCQSPNGEDWPKIAHIPSRYIPSGEAV